MKCDPSSSMSVLGIAGVSIIFPVVLSQLGVLEGIDSGNPLLAKKEVRTEAVKTIEPSYCLRENSFVTYVPPVYAIKPEEDVFVRDWREYSVRTNSKFG
jgi:hypothetical protein